MAFRVKTYLICASEPWLKICRYLVGVLYMSQQLLHGEHMHSSRHAAEAAHTSLLDNEEGNTGVQASAGGTVRESEERL